MNTEQKIRYIREVSVVPLRLLSSPLEEQREAPLSLPELVPPGRIVELSGRGARARTSTALSILLHAQAEGETCAWIQSERGELYPPDFHEGGVDLDALAIIRLPITAGAAAPCRAAELLLHSGAFGLVIVDLSRRRPPGSPTAWQSRLLALSRLHHCRLVLLSDSSADHDSLGPLIGLRFDSHPEPLAPPSSEGRSRYRLSHQVLKNKSGGVLDPAVELCESPWGAP